MASGDSWHLHRLLRDALAARMAGAGWVPDPAFGSEPGGLGLGAFRYPVADEFAAGVRFGLMSPARPDLRRPLEVDGAVGLSYERAYRLWHLLIEAERYELVLDLADLAGGLLPLTITVSEPSEIPMAAERLTAPVLSDALPWAREVASVDAVLDASRHDPRFAGHASEVVPVVLAAAGRPDDARRALAGYLADAEVADRDYRRFAYRLTRWLDSGVRLPGLPTAPVGEEVFDPDHSKKSDRRERQRDAWRRALQAVRPRAGHVTRHELRQQLLAELRRENVVIDDPIEVELSLDGLEAGPSRSEQRRFGFNLVKGVVGGAVRMFRSGEPPPLPAWLEPPAHALHDTPVDHGRWISVTPQPAIEPFLHRIFESLPTGMFNSVHFDTWLDWDSPAGPEAQIAVFAGDQQIGTVAPNDTATYEDALSRAALRGEQPLLEARITGLHDGTWLITLAVPASPSPQPPRQ